MRTSVFEAGQVKVVMLRDPIFKKEILVFAHYAYHNFSWG